MRQVSIGPCPADMPPGQSACRRRRAGLGDVAWQFAHSLRSRLRETARHRGVETGIAKTKNRCAAIADLGVMTENLPEIQYPGSGSIAIIHIPRAVLTTPKALSGSAEEDSPVIVQRSAITG